MNEKKEYMYTASSNERVSCWETSFYLLTLRA